MSLPAVVCQSVTKRYESGQYASYRTLRDSLASAILFPFRVLERGAGDKRKVLWALRDVSFQVEEGKVLGIIGRNGAGKTTLLKILSRITVPTEGRAWVYGRVGSLLEIGTGFHPELNGIDNIYLNGAMLGMKRSEITSKLEEIVSFAQLEDFMAMPVKHYSAGMRMRLGFSVAAHLETDVLLVDEVLAVGDLAFQRKCLGRMTDLAKAGRTVLFVSHQMNQIRRLCTRCIWLDDGVIRAEGDVANVVAAYETASVSPRNEDLLGSRPQDTGVARFLRWFLIGDAGGEPHTLTKAAPLTVAFQLLVNRPIRDGHSGIALYDREGRLIWANAVDRLRMSTGLHELRYRLETLPLIPGTYRWHVSIYDAGLLGDNWYCSPEMIVATQPLTHPSDEWQGVLNVPWDFEIA